MLKKSIYLSFLLLNICYAETCPQLSEIKSGNFRNFTPFNCDSGEEIHAKTIIDDFKKNVMSFQMAEWMDDAPEGPAHCYYYESEEKECPFNIYLVKNLQGPDKIQGNWHKVNLDIWQCDDSIDKCKYL